MMKHILALLLLLPFGYAHAADGPISFDAGLRVRYDDNIGFAPDKESRRDDVSTRIFGTIDWRAVRDTRNNLNFYLTPYYEGVKNLQDLSNWGAVLGGRYRHQFNEDFTAPWISVELEGTWLEFKDSEIRDGYKIEGEAALGKAFGPKFGGAIGYRYQKRVATNDFPEGSIIGGRSDEVFDQSRDGPFVKLDFIPRTGTTLFGEFTYLDGTVAATGDPRNFLNGQDFPRARDFAFEEGARFLAWRIPVEQNVWSLGWTQAMGEKFSFELSGIYQDATSDSGNDYDNWIVLGELVYAF